MDAISVDRDALAVSEHRPPPPLQLLAEWPRAAWTVASLALHWRRLGSMPKGDGRPVLVLPGLFNSDRSNVALRGHLRRLGYRSYGWELGRNFGQRTIGREGERLFARLDSIHRDTGEKVTLVGVSLGGIMARFAAHRHPELVREVITISSPFAGPPTATNVWRQFQWLTGESISDPALEALRHDIAQPLPVPATAIWSASDGLVNGQICRGADEGCRNIEIRSGHLGVQLKPEVLRIVAEVLGADDRKPASS